MEIPMLKPTRIEIHSYWPMKCVLPPLKSPEISLDRALRLVRLLVLVASSVVVDLVGAPNRMDDFFRLFTDQSEGSFWG